MSLLADLDPLALATRGLVASDAVPDALAIATLGRILAALNDPEPPPPGGTAWRVITRSRLEATPLTHSVVCACNG